MKEANRKVRRECGIDERGSEIDDRENSLNFAIYSFHVNRSNGCLKRRKRK